MFNKECTYEHTKLHKSTKIKLVWPFTSNARRKNGKKKVYKWKPMLRRPKNRWEDDIRNDMKKLKIKNWTTASRIGKIGNYRLRRPKRPKN
jgi:hypothetical protein